MAIAEIKARAREQVHNALALDAQCYEDGANGDSTKVSVRKHARIDPVGSLTGSGYTYSQQIEDNPRLVFLVAEHEPERGNVYSIAVGEAYQVDAVDPNYDTTVAVWASRLPEAEALQYAPPA